MNPQLPSDSFGRRYTRYFLQGLLLLAPIALTLFIFYKIFLLIDNPIRNVVLKWGGHEIWGVGFFVTVILAALILPLAGYFTSHVIGRSLLDLLGRQLDRFPPVKLLHSSLRDLIGAFVGDKKRFDTPVLVEIQPASGILITGFVTRRSMEVWGMADHVAVYIPMAFNFGGNMLIVPKDRVRPLHAPSREVMALIVSGGIAGEAVAEAKELPDPPAQPS